MKSRMQYISDYCEGQLSENEMRTFEDRLCSDDELLDAFLLFKQVNEYMCARVSLDEVSADEQLSEANTLAEQMISAYPESTPDDNSDLQFIRDSIIENTSARSNVKDEVKQIQYEINELNLDEITEGWVKDWRERQKTHGQDDPEVQRIKKYIKDSLNQQGRVEVKNTKRIFTLNKPWIKIAAGVAASVAIAGIIIMNLIISPAPERLFDQFYASMPATSPVTRSSDPVPVINYAGAVEIYRQGNYELAATLFSKIHSSEEGFTAARFFEGTSRIELGQYDQAISLLYEVAGAPGEYQKDAQWYLALACLKTNQTSRAAGYLEELAGMDGFYQDRAKRLLRRLR